MNQARCFEEEELWDLLDEGSLRKNEHLENCPRCKKRFEQLNDSLLEIQSVFKNKSPGLIPELDEFNDDFNGISISRYRILRSLSYGGQGQVYLAKDAQLNRNVAVKISHYSISEDLISSEMIQSEGELLAKINHPQLAQVYDAGMEDGRPFLVMEYVEGQTLKSFLCEKKLSSKQIQRIIREIAKAVQVVHDCGILHLDIKPENVIITPSGRCKVVDLGTSWLMSQSADDGGRVLGGTRKYMAPEQANADYEIVGPWTDVFGLGALLHTLLVACNESDTQSNNEDQGDLWVRGPGDLAKIHCPKFLTKICSKAISPVPEDRFQSVAEFIHTFEIAERTRQGSLLVASGLISCCLGGLQLLQYMPPAPQPIHSNHLTRALSNAIGCFKDDEPGEKYLQIRVVNLPSSPLHFCVWSQDDGLQFIPSVREQNSRGEESLRMLVQRSGLKLFEGHSPYWVMIIKEEFQGIAGTPNIKQRLLELMKQRSLEREISDKSIRFLNPSFSAISEKEPILPRIHSLRQQQFQNIHRYELVLEDAG